MIPPPARKAPEGECSLITKASILFRETLTRAAQIGRFVQDEQGQDLVEYSLLLAFVCLSGAALFIGMGRTTSGLWSIVNSRLASAAGS